MWVTIEYLLCGLVLRALFHISSHNPLRRCHLLNFTTKKIHCSLDLCVFEKHSCSPSIPTAHNTYLKYVSGIRNYTIIKWNVKTFFLLIFNILCMSTFAKYTLRKEHVLSKTSIKKRLVLNIQHGLNLKF